MILSRTPLRVSLFGGGSDMPEFFTQSPGAVVSFCINKYIYVGVNEKFDGRTRVSYSRTETVGDPAELEHDLVREALKFFQLKGLEITSISDIPGEGSGLGSSSAFTVGLVAALNHYLHNIDPHPSVYAQMAYHIERERCGHPVGKQDHYASAHGGLKFYQFNQDGTVNADPIKLTKTLRTWLESCVMLFWTGRTRRANIILKQQAFGFANESRLNFGKYLVEYAREVRLLLEDEKLESLGELLDGAWQYKKNLASVSNDEIDILYARARSAGAEGGKLCGAGGGGFLMLVAKPENQSAIEEAICLRRVPFKVEERGSQVVFSDR